MVCETSGDTLVMATGSITDITPLHSAAGLGDVDEVRELLEQGKYSVNCTDSDGWTPLYTLC